MVYIGYTVMNCCKNYSIILQQLAVYNYTVYCCKLQCILGSRSGLIKNTEYCCKYIVPTGQLMSHDLPGDAIFEGISCCVYKVLQSNLEYFFMFIML